MVAAGDAAARLSAAQAGGGGGQAAGAPAPEQGDAKNEQKQDQAEEAPVVQVPPQANPDGRNVAPATQAVPVVPPASAQVSAVPARAVPQPPPPAAIPRIHTQAFWSALDASADQLEEERRTERKVEIAFAAGVVVSAGYFVLTARGVYLALSALLARPLWKQFDPLDILFAWEQEKGRRLAELAAEEGEEEETLQTMVG
jgi:hypothetical protein